MAFCYRYPYAMLRRKVFVFLVTAWALMILPFVPSIGISINGARAWVQIGPIGFQPSEFLKLALLVYCANLLGRRNKEVADFGRVIRPILVALGISVALCLAQGDLGGTIVMTCIVLMLMFMSGIPMRVVGAIGGSAAFGALMITLISSSRRNRWMAFMNLDETKGSFGYQVWQSILSISNGGVSGVGIGAGTGKWGYVPLAHSDFIFSTIAEEFGSIGVVAVIGGFLLLVLLGFRVAMGAQEKFGALLA
ncbi:MAG: FtsW/RodA/SpoVE family cell cycle protein, partial [Actinomycetota bacterium]